MSFWCFQISQKIREFFSRISALASKNRSNKRIRVLYTTNRRILFWLSYGFFLFDLFLEARAEILEKKLWIFLGDLKTPKGHFKINWPLVPVVCFECGLNWGRGGFGRETFTLHSISAIRPARNRRIKCTKSKN